MIKEKLVVIKVGGKIVEEEQTLQKLLADFALLMAVKCWFTVVDVRQLNWLQNWALRAKW